MLLNPSQPEFAKCTHCDRLLKYTCDSSTRTKTTYTTTLSNHLKSVHKIDQNGKISEVDITQQHSQAKAHASEVLARLVALRNMSVHQISKADELYDSWKKAGLDIPKNREEMKRMVVGYAAEVKIKMIEELEKRLESGEKFSLSSDEWTSLGNRRYMGFELHCANTCSQYHCDKKYNLGLKRIRGSCTGEKCEEMIKQILREFKLDLKRDIVAFTSDGASVMKKCGRLLGINHLLCITHGLHLAVCEVLYKKPNSERTVQDDDSDDEEMRSTVQSDEYFEPAEIKEECQEIVSKVRKVV